MVRRRSSHEEPAPPDSAPETDRLVERARLRARLRGKRETAVRKPPEQREQR